MAEQLTLLSLGVDLDALARRIVVAQERAGLSDEACALVAGVSPERWRQWKDGTERPGVARVPKLAEAVKAPVSWLLYDADPLNVVIGTEMDAAMTRARRAAALLAEIIPMVEALARIADEVWRDSIPIVEGEDFAKSLRDVAHRLANASAVCTSHVQEFSV